VFMHYDAVVATDGTSAVTWLQAADVIVGQHRTRRLGRRWIASIHRSYPGCVVAVARHRRGRWCLVGLPSRTIAIRGDRFDAAAAVRAGHVGYVLWLVRQGVQP
jgi:hypothetical protein